jgi:hypothetical protein
VLTSRMNVSTWLRDRGPHAHDLAIVHGVVARLDWVPQAWMTSR